MSVAKPSSIGPPNAMKSDDGNDPLDLFLRQAIGTDNSAVQWVQLVHPFDQPDSPGWPLLMPLRIQQQTCDKCSREFCSPMNYRRHVRMHRRSLNIDKESHKDRDLLGAFWDKLSLEEAERVASFDDISLEGIPGTLIVDAWACSLFKPVVLTLPRAYLRDGTILLEIIQAKSSRLPISSQELFSILDETSERTFLCAGTAESVQKFLIDGGAEKALELNNLVASISLLFEQKLVKAWRAEKDVEALRCQKILVEEEEVAQKRQAQMLERKRRRKLRQKEQKARVQSNGEKTDSIVGEKTDSSADSSEGQSSAEISIPQFPFDNCCDTLTDIKPCLEQIKFSGKENEEFVETHCDSSSDHVGIDSIEFVGSSREWSTNDLYESTIGTWEVPKSYRRRQVGFFGRQNPSTVKHEPPQKQGPANETNDVANGVKVWARNPKIAVDEDTSRTTEQSVVAKIAIDVESSRTTGQNVAAESAIAVESSRTTRQNIVAERAIDIESSKTTGQNVVAETAIDVESSRTTLQNVVSKGEIVVESTTSSQKIVASQMDMSNCKLLIGSISVPVRNSTEEQHVSQGALTVSSEKCATSEKLKNSQESDSTLKGQDPKIAMSEDACVHEMRGNLPVSTGNQSCGENATLGQVADQTVTSLQSFVLVRNSTEEQHVSQGALTVSSEKCATPEKLKNSQESDSILKGQDPKIAMSEDVCEHEMRGNLPVSTGNQSCGENARLAQVADQTVTSLQSFVAKLNVSISDNKDPHRKRSVQPEGSALSSFDAKTFLAQRWKDAIASDHVKLVLSPEPSSAADGRNDCPLLDQTSDCCQYIKFGDAETPVAGFGPQVSFIKENSKNKFKKKTKKGATQTKKSQVKDI